MNIGHIELGKQPILLAPMEDVSDSPFRQVCKQHGADVVYTEFISSEGMIRDNDMTLHKMAFEEMERPFGIQIFGGREEAMQGATHIAAAARPDLVDINFGCPVAKVVNRNAGSACLRDLSLMERMAGIVVDSTDLPVTAKTRLGWDEQSIHIQEVALMLQSVGIKALTIHARTRSQKYKGQADYSWLKKVKETPGLHIPIIGNGDITSPQIAKQVFDETGVDGIMVGRAAIGDPWIFTRIKHYLAFGEELPEPDWRDRIELCARQVEMSVAHHGERYGVVIMKKHYGNYLKGIRNGKHLRLQLMEQNTVDELLEVLYNFSPDEHLTFAV